MSEFIERELVIKKLDHFQSHLHTVEGTTAIGVAKTLIDEIPAADVVSRGAYDQTDCERCVALTQLKEIGKGLGERMDDVRPVVLCRDCKFAPIGDKDGSDLEWPFDEFDENPCPYKCLDNWYSHKPAPNFFCAAGKKREES